MRFGGILIGSVLLAQTPADLTKVFDQYLAAVKAKDFHKVLAVYHSEAKKLVMEEYRSPQEQKAFLEQVAEMSPDGYEAPVVSPAGDKVLLRVMAKKNVPAAIQKEQKLPPVMQKPMVIEFAQEGGQWKMGPPSFSAPPQAEAVVRRPKDLKMGVRTDYEEGASTQLGGPILRLEKQTAGTVYVIRMLDEEVAAFVPANLVQAAFAAGKIVVLQGASHKQDPQKFWADQAKLHQR